MRRGGAAARAPLCALMLATLSLLSGCLDDVTAPGDLVLGNFGFVAEPVEVDDGGIACSGGGESFGFDALVAIDTTLDVVVFRIGVVDRPGSIEPVEGRFSITSSAPRDLGCATDVTLEEHLEGRFFLPSQAESLGYLCPASLDGLTVDGGTPVLPDGGELADAGRWGAFTPVLACGVVTHRSQPGADAGCPPCELRYRLRGLRR